MLAAQAEQTSLKKKPYKTTNKATGEAPPKKIVIPSEVERSMFLNIRTKRYALLTSTDCTTTGTGTQIAQGAVLSASAQH